MGKGERMITPPPAMDFSAILFDFDGVLVDTEWAIYQAWKRTFEGHGQHLPLDVYTRCIGTDFNTWSPKTHLEELTGKAFDWHDLDTRRQQEILRDLEHEKPMHGVPAVLETLSARGMPTAVVSSSSHQWVDGWLEKLGLARHFRTTVCRGDAPRIKPAPDLFLTAARRLEVDPAKCLVIEDSLNGMKAAHAAGMTVWIIPNRVTAGLDFSEAARIHRSLAHAAEEGLFG
jgi:HAD superfamily hydrolase (TIGR01509 family)